MSWFGQYDKYIFFKFWTIFLHLINLVDSNIILDPNKNIFNAIVVFVCHLQYKVFNGTLQVRYLQKKKIF